MTADQRIRVGLFLTCPVDLLRPSVGFASVKLLEQGACEVEVPTQSCCGQVAYNNGDPESAKALAWQLIQSFAHVDYVVLPSGSCAGMIKVHYPKLFENDSRSQEVIEFCERVFELTTFLSEVLNIQFPESASPDSIQLAYHDSCAGLRELNIKEQPRKLLKQCSQIALTEMSDTEVCCGFGGTFCVKFPDISNKMVEEKVANIRASGVDMIAGGDLSCLINIAGKIHRQQRDDPSLKKITVRHIAEILAGDFDAPGIGESSV